MWHRAVLCFWVSVTATVLCCGPAQGDVVAGIAAYERGDYAEAVDEWLVDAATGDPNALFNLGQAYRLGTGVEADLSKAETYYQRAARAGHPAAMGNLGTLYYFAKQPPLIEEALKWWQEGARSGDPRSQYLTGAMIFNGEHRRRDPVLAYAWTHLAAETGLQEARASLETMQSYISESDQMEALGLAPSLLSPEGRKYRQAMLSQSQDRLPEETAPRANAAAGATADRVDAKAEPSVAEGADKAAVSTPSSPGPVYRINLASLSREGAAEALWERYLSDHPDLFAQLPHRIETVTRSGSELHRLQAGRFGSADEAQSRCEKMHAAGADCFVIQTAD